MKMLLAGQWVDREPRMEVKHPYDGLLVDTVPQATAADVDRAIAAAVEGAKVMAQVSAYDRFVMLSAGAPQRGEAFVELTLTPGRYTIEAFYYSLRDDSIQAMDDHVITVS